MKMIKKEFVDEVAKDSGFTKKDVRKVVLTMFEVILDAALRGEVVRIWNFGVFKIKKRAAQVSCNPKTKEKVFCKEMKVLRFKPLTKFKKRINNL